MVQYRRTQQALSEAEKDPWAYQDKALDRFYATIEAIYPDITEDALDHMVANHPAWHRAFEQLEGDEGTIALAWRRRRNHWLPIFAELLKDAEACGNHELLPDLRKQLAKLEERP